MRSLLNSILVPHYSHFSVGSITPLIPVIFVHELEISHQHSLGVGGLIFGMTLLEMCRSFPHLLHVVCGRGALEQKNKKRHQTNGAMKKHESAHAVFNGHHPLHLQ